MTNQKQPKTGWDEEGRDKRLRQFEKRFLADLNTMKEKEQQQKNLTSKRSRWFNLKIQETEKKIARL